MKFIGKFGDGGKKDRIYYEEVEENIVRDKLFNILIQYDSIKFLIVVLRMIKNGESKDEIIGLVFGYLFFVIFVRWVGRFWGVGGKRFIKFCNLWLMFEWKGVWVDGLKEWDKYLVIVKEFVYVNDYYDGVFWMEFDDFCEYFN